MKNFEEEFQAAFVEEQLTGERRLVCATGHRSIGQIAQRSSQSHHIDVPQRNIKTSNQILFRNNNKNTLYMYMSNQNKYCYMVVTWHIMCRLPVTPKHKLIKYRYIYTYRYTHRITKSLFSI